MAQKRRRKTIPNLWPFDSFKKTTVYHVKRGKVSKATSTTRFKGYKIYETDNGFTIPEIDSSEFDTKSDAKKFITAWTKHNNPGTTIYIKNPADWFAKCVAGVKASGSSYDPNAVCGSVLRRKLAKRRKK